MSDPSVVLPSAPRKRTDLGVLMEPILPPVSFLVEHYRSINVSTPLPAFCELEARLGRLNPTTKKWESGVARDHWYATLASLQDSPFWTTPSTTPSHGLDLHDYIYKRVTGEEVRSSVVIGPSAATPSGVVTIHHSSKVRHGNVDVTVDGDEYEGTLERYGVRFSVSVETPVSSEDLEASVKPIWVRLKRRHSFIYNQWRFDLTRVWSAPSRTEAEVKQSRGEPSSYEIEIECWQPRELLALRSNRYIAASLMMKMVDMLPYAPSALRGTLNM